MTDSKYKVCSCGMLVHSGHKDRHIRSWWHRNYAAARLYRKKGLSYAEIARQLNSTRAYVQKMMSRLCPR